MLCPRCKEGKMRVRESREGAYNGADPEPGTCYRRRVCDQCGFEAYTTERCACE